MAFKNSTLVRALTILTGLALSLVSFRVESAGCENYASNQPADFVGEANLVYFHFGDSYLTTLAQETVLLSKAFEKSDYNVLMYDENATGGSKFLKTKARNMADEILYPSEEGFIDALKRLRDAGYVINLWIFSHGSTYYSSTDQKEYAYFVAPEGIISEKDILNEFNDASCDDLPIRLVYSIACYHSFFNDTWRAVGAKTTLGARYVNFYPTQYGKFATDWKAGVSAITAEANSDTSLSRTVVQSYIAAESLAYSNQGDCSWFPNVLGKTDCAAWYFGDGGPYAMGDDYNESNSGKWNMNNASDKVFSGSTSAKYNTTQSWNLR